MPDPGCLFRIKTRREYKKVKYRVLSYIHLHLLLLAIVRLLSCPTHQGQVHHHHWEPAHRPFPALSCLFPSAYSSLHSPPLSPCYSAPIVPARPLSLALHLVSQLNSSPLTCHRSHFFFSLPTLGVFLFSPFIPKSVSSFQHPTSITQHPPNSLGSLSLSLLLSFSFSLGSHSLSLSVLDALIPLSTTKLPITASSERLS